MGYWELDVISGDLFWSDELFCICGFKAQEFIATRNDFMKLIHPDDKESVVNVIVQPLNDSECELDFRIINHEDKTIWIYENKRNDYNSSGKTVRKYGIIHDITQRKLSEVKLKESEVKFKEIAENLGEVIWVRRDEQKFYAIVEKYIS